MDAKALHLYRHSVARSYRSPAVHSSVTANYRDEAVYTSVSAKYRSPAAQTSVNAKYRSPAAQTSGTAGYRSSAVRGVAAMLSLIHFAVEDVASSARTRIGQSRIYQIKMPEKQLMTKNHVIFLPENHSTLWVPGCGCRFSSIFRITYFVFRLL